MAQFLTDTQINSVYELYIGYFNRAPEAGGLNYWSNYYLAQVNAGKTDAAIQKEIANKFYDAAVQYNIYTAGAPVADFIKASYLNALGRDSVDDAGMTYWTAKLTSGEVTRGEFVQKLISDAKGFASDATYGWVSKYLDNRMAVAKAFAAVNTTTGDAAITAGKSALSAVTPDLVKAGQTPEQALTAAGFGGNSNEAAKPYVLTTAQDVLTGTTGDDFFRAVAGVQVGQQDQTTLNSSDIIKGGTGNDTLIVNMTGPNYNGGARISGIETLKIGTNQPNANFDYNVNAGSNEIENVKTIVADQINTGETLTIANLVRDDASSATPSPIPTLSWINDNTGANGLAGTVNVNYRAATVAGNADEQAVSLTNVRAGTLNLNTGIEKVTLTSAGTATNSIDKVQSGTTLIDVVIKADAQLGGARVVSDVAATKGLEINRTATNANTEHTSFVNMGASVKNVTAEGSKAGVNIAFTDTTAVDNTFVGGDGADTVIVNGGNDKLTGGKGADTFIFRQTNTSANGSFFNNSDTIDGGEGSDTIMIDYAKDSAGTQTQVVIQTSEWLNSKGLDVLDLRATNTRVQLDDAFVGKNDVSSFEVVTNKIVQSDSTTSVADEANSRHQIDLTTVGASRAVKVTGGEGRESVIVTDALNGVQTVAGGNGLDVLVVQNGATLTGQDLANVSGMNVFNLVKTSGNAQSYQIDLTADFLTKAVDANAAAGTSKNTANAFRILTDTADGSAATISGVQALAAGDTINITVDTTGLTTAGAINLDDLIASGATLTVKNTSGTTLLAASAGAVTTPGTGIFAGAASTANTAYTNLTTNPVAGVGTPVASGQASSGGSSGGSSGSAGNTFMLTANSAVLMTTGSSAGVTPAGNLTAGTKDIIEANINLNKAFIQDTSSTDGDVLNATLTAGYTAGPEQATIIGIENLNITGAGGVLDLAKVSGATAINLVNGNVNLTNVAATSPVGINAGFAGTANLKSANATGTSLFAVSLAGGSSTANLQFQDSGALALAAADVITLTTSAASSLNQLYTGAAGTVAGTAGAVTVKGTGDLTIADFGTKILTADSTYTGKLNITFNAAAANSVTGSAQDDTFNFAAGLTNGDVVNGGAGTDTLTFKDSNGAATDLDNVTNVEVVKILDGATANVATAQGLVAFGKSLTVDASAVTSAYTVTWDGSLETDGTFNIVGGAGDDIITGGAGPDTIKGGEGADTITTGKGNDVVDLSETTSKVDTLKYEESGTANVDTVTGFKAGTDIVSFTKGNIDAVATYNFASTGGTDVNATGAATVGVVAAGTSAALADAANLIFFSSTAATSFATAIGAAVITDTTGTNWSNTTSVASVYYDSAKGQAVFGYVVDSAATGTALTSADTFVEIARVGMASTDYTQANIAASFSFF